MSTTIPMQGRITFGEIINWNWVNTTVNGQKKSARRKRKECKLSNKIRSNIKRKIIKVDLKEP
jgi:hypothetical protein